jgi:hypothetical protein
MNQSGSNTSEWEWVFIIIVGTAVLYAVWDSEWFNKTRYSLANDDVTYEHVIVSAKPHDCDFMTAPMGEKNCHYKKEADKWANDGVQYLYVSWLKVMD